MKNIDEQLSERLARLQALADSLPEEPAIDPVGSDSTRPHTPEIVLYQSRGGQWLQAKEVGGKLVSLSTGREVPPKNCKIK